jgi:hypothetical protein
MLSGFPVRKILRKRKNVVRVKDINLLVSISPLKSARFSCRFRIALTGGLLAAVVSPKKRTCGRPAGISRLRLGPRLILPGGPPYRFRIGWNSQAFDAQIGNVTQLEVISDAIKIGLPVLGTGLIAILIARATRSYELEKESRRRRQDALEKISDDFQAACFRLWDLAIKYSTYRESLNDPETRIAHFTELFESGGAIDAAIEDLHRIRGRLKLHGLKKCEEALVEFLNQTIAFRKMLKLPPEPMAKKEVIGEKIYELKHLQDAVERLLADAFETL